MKYMVMPRHDLSARYGGGWALVTGASDGIGKQYCFELAKSGFNIILMARNKDKTTAVAQEITEKYSSVQTKTIIYDFSNLSTQGSAEELKALLERELDGIDVSILVNNVGTARNAPLENQSFSDLTHQINININA